MAALAVGRAAPANPALALRAIRLCLAEPELFLTQLRAILRASAHGPVRIMIPLVSGPNEMILARRMIQTAMQQLDTRGLAYDRGILVGAMIEVPSAAIAIDTSAAQPQLCEAIVPRCELFFVACMSGDNRLIFVVTHICHGRTAVVCGGWHSPVAHSSDMLH